MDAGTWRTSATRRRSRGRAATPRSDTKIRRCEPPGDQYATKHDPFVYFHSIIDSPSCATNVVGLDALAADLASTKKTANLTYITPTASAAG